MDLFTPIKVGNIILKNRIIFPPLTTGYEDKNGAITKKSIEFYKRIAAGGVSYIVIGDISPVRTISPTPKLYEDSLIQSFKELTEAIHKEGTLIGAQIFHPEYDPEESANLFKKGDLGALRIKLHNDMENFCNDISIDKIHIIQDQMVSCAKRAVKAGFDVIQIHGDRTIGMFCSPIMNKRTDEYGGSLENRARFALELVRKIREELPDTPLEYKLAMIRMEPRYGKGGPTIEEGSILAKWLEEEGINMIHACQANHTKIGDTLPAMGMQPYGCFVDMAEAIKKSVDIPVSAVGRIITPEFAEEIIASGKADIVSLGRQLLCDPDWPKKVKEGKSADIRYCIMCNKGCTDKITGRSSIGCVLNAENGYEGEKMIIPTEDKKKVVVIGGGIAGLEAARVAAIKGHSVTLFEKDTKLGGQLNIAAIPPRKDEMIRAINYLSHSLVVAGVELVLGREVKEEDILNIKPDAVIIAVGSENITIPVKGSERPNVLSAWKVLSNEQLCGNSVAVIGGGLVGSETAEFLAEKGIDVSIIEMLDVIAKEESSSIRPTMIKNLEKNLVKLYTNHKLIEIKSNLIVCENKEGQRVEIPCHYVIMAVGAKPIKFNSEKLTAAGIKVTYIGDCKERASDIENAIKTAYDTANSI